MSKRRKILILVPSLTSGGAERAASNLSSALEGAYDVVLAVHDEGRGVVYPFGGELVDLATPVAATFPGKLLTAARRVGRARRVKHRHSVDLSISFMESSNFVNLLSRRGEPALVSVQNHNAARTDPSDLVARLHGVLSRTLYRRARAVVAPSTGVARSLAREYGLAWDRIEVVPNTVDVELVTRLAGESLPEGYAFLDRAPVVSNVGRLTAQKGQGHLIRVFAAVKRKVADARLLIIGDGELRDELSGMARALDLSVHADWERGSTGPGDADVVFAGFRTNPFPLLSRAAVFAFPSLWEGLPNAPLENMALGVPVVSADCPSGPREILSPASDPEVRTTSPEPTPYGFLMPVCDGALGPEAPLTAAEADWADTLADLLRDAPSRDRLAAAGRDRVRDFSVERVRDAWVRLIENTLDR